MNITITPEYEHLRDILSKVPQTMTNDKNKLLYNGRNKIVCLEMPDGESLVVKKFKRHNLLKQIIYTFFRKNKAYNSFYNAKKLKSLGFDTPAPVAFIEEKTHGLITQVYYICAYTDKKALAPMLTAAEPYDKELATAYARYVALLHSSGVLHLDLNSTNVLCEKTDNGYCFQLIDINRMRFYKGPVPEELCMENMTLFWHFDELYRYVLDCYAKARRWDGAKIEKAIQTKLRHDRNWHRRKKFSKKIKSIFSK